MNYEQLQALVPAPGRQPDYRACLAAFPALEQAKTTPQEPAQHANAPLPSN